LTDQRKGATVALQLESTQEIDRPVDKVFQFFAVDHVKNHPRWDEDIDLWLDSDEPIGVGTIIHKCNRRSGTPVEGTMEVVKFIPNRMMEVIIHDGPMMMGAVTTFEPVSKNRTRITTVIDIPGMDEHADTTFINSRLERSARIRKQLMESEIP
jgi:hypothetical protein